MSKAVEFSRFFQLLDDIKNGQNDKLKQLDMLLEEYDSHISSEGYLQDLGETYCCIGLIEIYVYSGMRNIPAICKLEKDEWESLSESNSSPLPQYLANKMISYSKDNDLVKNLSEKWNAPRRDISKHINNMAKFITEGLIQLLE